MISFKSILIFVQYNAIFAGGEGDALTEQLSEQFIIFFQL